MLLLLRTNGRSTPLRRRTSRKECTRMDIDFMALHPRQRGGDPDSTLCGGGTNCRSTFFPDQLSGWAASVSGLVMRSGSHQGFNRFLGSPDVRRGNTSALFRGEGGQGRSVRWFEGSKDQRILIRFWWVIANLQCGIPVETVEDPRGAVQGSGDYPEVICCNSDSHITTFDEGESPI
jgi:hypothetical protein